MDDENALPPNIAPLTGGNKHTPVTDFRKQRLLDWLCTPVKERKPKTIIELAEELQVTRRTISTWKNDDKEFMEEWEKRYLRTIGNPERKSDIMSTLLKTATDGDDPKHVQAAKAYFEIEGSLKPAKMEVQVTRPAANLSDAELEELLTARAAEEKKARQERKSA